MSRVFHFFRRSFWSRQDFLDDLEYEQEHMISKDASYSMPEDESPPNSLGTMRLFALTCGILGLQVVWSVIISQGAPFLISIGLSKSFTALVWIAGPICGAFIQPLVGYMSDRSQSSFGRRRPFIAIGAVSTVFSILMLGWTEEVLYLLAEILGVEYQQAHFSNAVIAITVFWIWALNISIQPLQVGLRALVAENCPAHQQAQASAWTSRMTGVSNITGCLVGFAPLPEVFRLVCRTQFQGLCLTAVVALATTIPITCVFVREQNPGKAFTDSVACSGLVATSRRLMLAFTTMPIRIRRVCQIQFFAWMGWFPFLFFITTYVSDLYSMPLLSHATNLFPSPHDTMQENRTRAGTFAMFLFASVALLANIFLPLIVSKEPSSAARQSCGRRKLLLSKPSITQAWAATHVFFALAMLSTVFVSTYEGGNLVVASAGISWAMTIWAPYTIIGTEIARKNKQEQALGMAETEPTERAQAGSIMSLHNMAISLPQILAALACSAIFWVATAAGSTDGAAWVLRAGGLAALAAAWTTSGLDDR